MITDTPFIVFNVDLAHDELPPLLRDFKYIRNSKAGISELVEAIELHVRTPGVRLRKHKRPRSRTPRKRRSK
jgi:hypothetical protein